MSPEKVLDLTVKFGVVPVLFYVVMITRADVEDMKRDLKDCYQDRIEELKPRSVNRTIKIGFRPVAILPSKCKTVQECLV